MTKNISEDVKKEIIALQSLKDNHYEMGKAYFKRQTDSMYVFDFFVVACLNRSMCLLRGFCEQILSANFLCAAPLVRLELDTCMRFFAFGLVKDINEFGSEVLGGTPIRKLKDRNDHLMTDFYLKEKLGAIFPWTINVYDHTSAFVHLSEKHIFNSLKLVDGNKGEVSLKISDTDKFVPDEAYLEAIAGFRALTVLFLDLVGEFINRRNAEMPLP